MAQGDKKQVRLDGKEEPCVFCQIISKEVGGAIVLEDENCVAFLDHKPLFPGHVILVPRGHFQTLTDVPDQVLLSIGYNARLLSIAEEVALGAEGEFVAINNKVSQSVPHFHVHIVPRKFKDGLHGFFWPRQKYKDDAEMNEYRDKLKNAVTALQRI